VLGSFGGLPHALVRLYNWGYRPIHKHVWIYERTSLGWAVVTNSQGTLSFERERERKSHSILYIIVVDLRFSSVTVSPEAHHIIVVDLRFSSVTVSPEAHHKACITTATAPVSCNEARAVAYCSIQLCVHLWVRVRLLRFLYKHIAWVSKSSQCINFLLLSAFTRIPNVTKVSRPSTTIKTAPQRCYLVLWYCHC
jgi:hypothetical protein